MTALAGTTAILSPHTLQKWSATFLSLIKHFTTAFELCLLTQSVKHWAKSITVPQGSRLRSEIQNYLKSPFQKFLWFPFNMQWSAMTSLKKKKKTIIEMALIYWQKKETTVTWKTFLNKVWGFNLNLRKSINVKQPTVTPYVMHCSVLTRRCHLIALLLILPTRSRLCFEKENAAVFFVLILICGVWGFFFFS